MSKSLILVVLVSIIFIGCSSKLNCYREKLIGMWYADSIITPTELDFDDHSIWFKPNGTCRLPWTTSDGIVLFQSYELSEIKGKVYITISGEQALSGKYLLECKCEFKKSIDTLFLKSNLTRLEFYKLD